MRKQFADFIKAQLKQRENIVVLLGDISVGLFLDETGNLPDRVYNVGILEQSMVSMAAGMSSAGCEVFVHTISPFIVERALEQIKIDVAYNRNKVILVSANGPGDYNKLGPTHHCFSDVNIINLIPDFKIYLPGRDQDVGDCLAAAMDDGSSAYIRLTSRSATISTVPGRINLVDTPHSKLNVFIGESLRHFELNRGTITGDWVYTDRFDRLSLDSLKAYDAVVFWEPYSNQIAGTHFRQFLPRTSILSMVYPLSIENGIFDSIEYRPIRI